MCAAVLNYSENKRFVDRIRAVTLREARDAALVHPLFLGLGLLYSLEGLRTLSNVTIV